MSQLDSTRRSFMSRLGAAAAAFGVGAVSAEAAQAPKPAAGMAFHAAKHTQDAWLDAAKGKHRIVIDATTANGAGDAILFANNLFTAHKDAYAGAERDLSILLVMRHWATPFAFTDTLWAKYGKAIGGMIHFQDPKTKEGPTSNLYNSAAYGLQLNTLGNTIDGIRAKGATFAICDMATKFASQGLAGAGMGTMDAIYKDFTSNTIPDSRFVPAGVVAVTRAQEHGYTLIYAG
jgi:hypothetical protein